MNEHLFLEAATEVAAAIRRAVALADGDSARALGQLLAWADSRPDRQRVLFQSTRYRVGRLAAQEEALDRAIEVAGDDEDLALRATCELLDPLESPTLRERFDRELAAAVEAAIVEWIGEECRRDRKSVV